MKGSYAPLVLLFFVMNRSNFSDAEIKTHHDWHDFKMYEKWTTLYPVTGTMDFNYIRTKTPSTSVSALASRFQTVEKNPR